MGRADIVVLVLDALLGPTEQDFRLAELIGQSGRGCVLCMNKWDLVPKVGVCLKTLNPKLHQCFSVKPQRLKPCIRVALNRSLTTPAFVWMWYTLNWNETCTKVAFVTHSGMIFAIKRYSKMNT